MGDTDDLCLPAGDDVEWNMDKYINSCTCQRVYKLPSHVCRWVNTHFDELVELHEVLLAYCEKKPYLMDKSNIAAFCACVARLSTIDSPCGWMGRTGGRLLVHDFINTRKSELADAEVAAAVITKE